MGMRLIQRCGILAVALGCLGILCGAARADGSPAGGALVWDINFSGAEIGAPVPVSGLTDAKMFASRDRGEAVPAPLTAFATLDYVLPTRRATVQTDLFGLAGRSCLVEVAPEDPGREVGQSRGPRLSVYVPPAYRGAQRWRLSFDLAAPVRMQMGALYTDAFSLYFFSDGVLGMDAPGGGRVDICPYRPSQPVHLEIVGDRRQGTITFTADRQPATALELPWRGDPQAHAGDFSYLIVMGMSTGPHTSVGKFALGNLRLESLDPPAPKG
jgi:hypothetical protein